MDLSPRLSLSYVLPQQAQKHVTINETFRRLDALVQLSVLSRTAVNEPANPAEGDAYILPAGKTGASWSSFADQSVAAFRDGVWSEIAAVGGFIAYVADEDSFYRFAGGNWGAFSGASSGNSTLLGVNTIADTTNRLAVKSDASLFNHDDVTPGTGDHRLTINKAAVADTGSVLFQTSASGRAEMGLLGDDDFHIKVSPDNFSTSFEAMVIDKATGNITVSQKLGIGTSAPFSKVDIRGFDATTSTDTFRIRPDDWGAGKPQMSISKTTTANRFDLNFWDGSSNAGVFNMGANALIVNGASGVVAGSPTGGDKGLGTINAMAVYDDNSLLSCYVFDQALDGAIDLAKWDAKAPDGRHDGARRFAGRIGTAHDPLTLDEYAAHWRENRHLSSLPNEATFDAARDKLSTGEWVQRLVETVEIQAVLIEQLNARLRDLEAARSHQAG